MLREKFPVDPRLKAAFLNLEVGEFQEKVYPIICLFLLSGLRDLNSFHLRPLRLRFPVEDEEAAQLGQGCFFRHALSLGELFGRKLGSDFPEVTWSKEQLRKCMRDFLVNLGFILESDPSLRRQFFGIKPLELDEILYRVVVYHLLTGNVGYLQDPLQPFAMKMNLLHMLAAWGGPANLVDSVVRGSVARKGVPVADRESLFSLTPLHLAALNNQKELAEALLKFMKKEELGVSCLFSDDILCQEDPEYIGGTSLHMALSMGNFEVAEVILNGMELKERLTPNPLDGELAIDVAMRIGRVDFLEKFLTIADSIELGYSKCWGKPAIEILHDRATVRSNTAQEVNGVPLMPLSREASESLQTQIICIQLLFEVGEQRMETEFLRG